MATTSCQISVRPVSVGSLPNFSTRPTSRSTADAQTDNTPHTTKWMSAGLRENMGRRINMIRPLASIKQTSGVIESPITKSHTAIARTIA